ncbi:hypothetical protein EON62_00010, partial [archaeon]
MSRDVRSLEADFPAAFRDTARSDDIVKNFSALQPTIMRLGIKFTARQVDAIIKGTPGVVARVLYEIKTQLSRLERFPVGTMREDAGKPVINMQVCGGGGGCCGGGNVHTSAGTHAPTSRTRARAPHIMQMKGRKPAFEAMMHTTFHERLRVLAGNQKEKDMAAALRTHEEEYARLVEQRAAQHAAREEAKRKYLADLREQRLDLLREGHNRLRAMEEEGVRQWMANQLVRHGEERSRRFYLMRTAARTQAHASATAASVADEVAMGTSEFEAILHAQRVVASSSLPEDEEYGASDAGALDPRPSASSGHAAAAAATGSVASPRAGGMGGYRATGGSGGLDVGSRITSPRNSVSQAQSQDEFFETLKGAAVEAGAVESAAAAAEVMAKLRRKKALVDE